jgi:hypothetical protein
MQNNENIYDASSLTTKEIINRLILLGEDIDSQTQNRQFYLDLYQNIINRDPANLEILKRYVSNKRKLTDSVLSRKRGRDDNADGGNNITKMQNYCGGGTRMTSSEKKYRARTFNDLHILNYPSINVKIEVDEDVILEVDESPNNYQPANKPESPSPIRPTNINPPKVCVGDCLKQEKMKRVNTLNIKNLLGVAGVMGLSGVTYCIYQRIDEIVKYLEPFIDSVTNLLQNPNFQYTMIGIFGFVVLVFILKKLKELMDKKLDSIARKIIKEAEINLSCLSKAGISDGIDSEAFVDDFCRQNKVWIMKSCIMTEITKLLNNREEKLEEKVSKKTWVLK